MLEQTKFFRNETASMLQQKMHASAITAFSLVKTTILKSFSALPTHMMNICKVKVR